MESTAATYYYNGQGASATATLLKHKLSIQIERDGALSEVFWYYDQVMKGDGGEFLYPGPARQVLHIPSAAFAEALTGRMAQQAKSVYSRRGSTLLKLLLAIVILGVVLYFVAVPRIASGLAGNVSMNYEKELGEGMYRSMRGSFTVDEKRTALINEFFRQLNVRSDYNIQITVVKGDVANAFAIPGGRIVVYDKLLSGITSYPQLAALLAHEYVHVQNRHTLRSLFRQLSSRMILSLLLGNLDVVGAVLVQNTDQLKDLSYSRSLETEADEEGALLLAKRGVDCKGFVELFELLQKETGGQEVPEFINSHPNL
ncbi:MAG TPA: M48 family metallopeptidase, partial [Chitinophagaceae bacterium]